MGDMTIKEKMQSTQEWLELFEQLDQHARGRHSLGQEAAAEIKIKVPEIMKDTKAICDDVTIEKEGGLRDKYDALVGLPVEIKVYDHMYIFETLKNLKEEINTINEKLDKILNRKK